MIVNYHTTKYDLHIMELIREFVSEFLENENFWFSQDDDVDEYLMTKYQSALDFGLDISLEKLSNDDIANIVITCDQLPRHVFRHCDSNHIIEHFLHMSLMFYDRLDVDKIRDDVVFCFVHLPLRHAKNQLWIHHSIKKVWRRGTSHEFSRRFLKAAYERCPTEDQTQFIHTVYEDVVFSSAKHAHTTFFTPDDYALKIDRENHIVKEVEKALQITKPTDITMSISGGVDSMTLFHILEGLKGAYGYKLRAVMVNYTNRTCAYDEESFVTDWVNWLGIPLNIRRIEEIKRKPCIDIGIRKVYETYTRNVRYGTYKTLSKDALVGMGHNKDDVLENIFQNIATQTKYDNLGGMNLVVEQDNIKFFRPLLNVSKDDIINYARTHNIPYLPNSTPPHFMRGQIRNTIVPTMNAWNTDFIHGLFKLNDNLSELTDAMVILVENFIDAYSVDRTVSASILKMKTMFWKAFLLKLFPGETFHSKMFDSFMISLSRFDKVVKFQLNKKRCIKLVQKNSKIHISFL